MEIDRRVPILKKEARLQRENKPSYYREFQDSPNFYKNLGAFAVSTKKLTDFETEFPTAKKFFPLTTIQIINSSNCDIIFYPNQRSTGFLIPNNTSTIFDRKTLGGGLRSFAILNTSASNTIADGELEVNFWREGITIDRAFENLHKAFYKFVKIGGV